MRLEFEVVFNKSRILELSQLIPEKFRNTPIMVDLIPELNYQVGRMLEYTDDLITIIDPNVVRWEYLKHLGALIGIEFIEANASLESAMRKEIVNAMDWYKVKGTYKAMEILAKLINYDVNIYDRYTNDYVNFVSVPWFVGDEGENPPGLDHTYYKSPHFDFEIVLNEIVESDSTSETIWTFGSFENLQRYMDKMRPVNTVPHYSTVLGGDINPPPQSSSGADEDITITGNSVVKRWVTGSETLQTLFDEDETLGVAKQFDDGISFDVYDTTWASNLTDYTFGTGNDGVDVAERYTILDASGFAISNDAYSNTLDASDVVEDNEKIVITCSIPENVSIEGLSELGVYTGSVLTVAMLFPNINKSLAEKTNIQITIWK